MPRLRALVVALLLCAVLGCEAEPTPDIPAPTPSSSAPSPTESESTPSPSTPQALTPEQTVRAWFEAWTLALQTGDTNSVMALSSSECLSCARLISKVEDLYAKGGRLETRGWIPLTTASAPNSTSEMPVFLLRVEEGRQVLLNDADEVVDETPRMEVPMRITLGPKREAWVVTRLEILS